MFQLLGSTIPFKPLVSNINLHPFDPYDAEGTVLHYCSGPLEPDAEVVYRAVQARPRLLKAPGFKSSNLMKDEFALNFETWFCLSLRPVHRGGR